MSTWRWMTAAVLLHLVVSIVHGAAHAGASVPLSPAANRFVWFVVFLGPLGGLALTWPAEKLGGWVVAITMSGAFVFGLVNHFVLDTPDHVANVAAEWQLLFATSAILLALSELLAVGLAVGVVRERRKL